MKSKIVFLRLNPKATGGAEKYLSRLSKTLASNGIFNTIRSYRGSLKLSSWIKALIFNYQAKQEKSSDELYFSLERIDSADIYRAGDGVHKIYRQSKKMWWLNPLNFIYPYLEKRCFNNAKIIIANSNMVKNQIIQAYGIDDSKIKLIYNGVKIPQKLDKKSAKIEICSEFGLDCKLPIVLFVGSGFKRKGVSELLDILSNLNSKVNTIIIGKDKKQDFYEKKADKLGLERIKFLGVRSDVARFYEGSDVFVFPTTYEPFSNVILEALSYGCPSFSTVYNGASEILPNEWVLSGDTKRDAKLVLEVLSQDSEKNQKKALNIVQNFSIEKNASLSLEVINQALQIKANMLKCE